MKDGVAVKLVAHLVASHSQHHICNMNRRSFTASLAALFAAPTLPDVASVAPSAVSQTAVSHYATAKLLARAHNRCSPETLQRLLRVDGAIARELNAMLLKRGVISSSSARGALMAVEPLNTHCITNEAMRASNMAQKLRDAKAQLDKLSRGMNAPEQENPDDADVARISATEAGQAKL